jgi:hypothetical protein
MRKLLLVSAGTSQSGYDVVGYQGGYVPGRGLLLLVPQSETSNSLQAPIALCQLYKYIIQHEFI